jgi:hypothetical protein
LLITLEDSDDELQRRIKAVLDHYGIDRSDLRGWLFCKAVRRQKLAELVGRQRLVGPLEKLLRAAIARRKPDVISLDPFGYVRLDSAKVNIATRSGGLVQDRRRPDQQRHAGLPRRGYHPGGRALVTTGRLGRALRRHAQCHSRSHRCRMPRRQRPPDR